MRRESDGSHGARESCVAFHAFTHSRYHLSRPSVSIPCHTTFSLRSHRRPGRVSQPEPVDPQIPGYEQAWAEMGLAGPKRPRKQDPDYRACPRLVPAPGTRARRVARRAGRTGLPRRHRAGRRQRLPQRARGRRLARLGVHRRGKGRSAGGRHQRWRLHRQPLDRAGRVRRAGAGAGRQAGRAHRRGRGHRQDRAGRARPQRRRDRSGARGRHRSHRRRGARRSSTKTRSAGPTPRSTCRSITRSPPTTRTMWHTSA